MRKRRDGEVGARAASEGAGSSSRQWDHGYCVQWGVEGLGFQRTRPRLKGTVRDRSQHPSSHKAAEA